MATYVILPAGLFDAGIYDGQAIPAGPANPIVIAADKIDPLTGELASWLTTVSPVQGAVVEALRIREGSGAAVEGVGNRLHEIEYVTPSADQEIENEIRRCMKPLTDDGRLRVEGFKIETEARDQKSVEFTFYDLVFDQEESVPA